MKKLLAAAIAILLVGCASIDIKDVHHVEEGNHYLDLIERSMAFVGRYYKNPVGLPERWTSPLEVYGECVSYAARFVYHWNAHNARTAFIVTAGSNNNPFGRHRDAFMRLDRIERLEVPERQGGLFDMDNRGLNRRYVGASGIYAYYVTVLRLNQTMRHPLVESSDLIFMNHAWVYIEGLAYVEPYWVDHNPNVPISNFVLFID